MWLVVAVSEVSQQEEFQSWAIKEKNGACEFKDNNYIIFRDKQKAEQAE